MTRPPQPFLLASNRTDFWTLQDPLRLDHFGWHRQGAGALLLLGMHVSDPRPWQCARNPVLLADEPGWIDRASKRILGKRYRSMDASEAVKGSIHALDPLSLINGVVQRSGFDPSSPYPQFPELTKEPGKLLPRPLTAGVKAQCTGGAIELSSRNFTEVSQVLHAELVLLSLLSARLSTGAFGEIERFEFETTLKPCKMCAAFLHSIRAFTREFSVRYHEEDPGPLAQGTLLDQHGYRS